jgi:hypothetical protein
MDVQGPLPTLSTVFGQVCLWYCGTLLWSLSIVIWPHRRCLVCAVATV